MSVDFRRRKTSNDRLEIDWNHPVYAPDLKKKVEKGRTSTAYVDVALLRDEAFLRIRGEDHRPLLIVRECGFCKGTDDALLTRRINNERTVLMTQWFHCVKLPNNVLKQNHPFRKLFAQEHPPHLFLASWDGATVIPMTGLQTQSQLWKSMDVLLKQHYKKDSKSALKELAKLLNEYDQIDIRQDEHAARREQAMVKYGPKSSKVKALSQKIAKLEKQRKRASAREAKVRNLGLVPLSKEKQLEFDADRDKLVGGN